MYYSVLDAADCNNFGHEPTSTKVSCRMRLADSLTYAKIARLTSQHNSKLSHWRNANSYTQTELHRGFSVRKNFRVLDSSAKDQSTRMQRHLFSIFLSLLSTSHYRISPFAFSPFSRPWNLISVIKHGINLNLNAITLIHFARFLSSAFRTDQRGLKLSLSWSSPCLSEKIRDYYPVSLTINNLRTQAPYRKFEKYFRSQYLLALMLRSDIVANSNCNFPRKINYHLIQWLVLYILL